MIKDPYRKIREALGLAKKYSDEKLVEAKQYTDERLAALPKPPEPEPIDVAAIAAAVTAMLPKPKKLKRKKKNQAPAMTPEEVMALILGALEDVNTEYIKTGDTVIIQEAPQRIVEHIKEVVRTEGKDVDYDLIYKELDKRMMEWRATIPHGGGSYESLSMLRDVNLDGVPQNSEGKYLLGQVGGSASGATFEYVSKNLNSYPHAMTRVNGEIQSITYTTPGGDITKTINRTGGLVSSVVLSGELPPALSVTTKTITRNPDGDISSISYS